MGAGVTLEKIESALDKGRFFKIDVKQEVETVALIEQDHEALQTEGHHDKISVDLGGRRIIKKDNEESAKSIYAHEG